MKTRTNVSTDIHELLFDVLERLTDDCKKICAQELLRLVNYLIEVTVQESIICPCAADIKNAEVTLRYSKDFRDVIDIDLCTERAIRDVVSGKVSLILGQYRCTMEQQLDEMYILLYREAK